MKQAPVQLNIANTNGFIVQYFYPEEDHSDSWRMHNGLTGHIEFNTRSDHHVALKHKIASHIEQLNLRPDKKNHTNTLINVAHILEQNLSGASSKAFSTLLEGKTLNYHMISGYSRSGGTYMISEYAKMRSDDVLKKHIYWTHDFFPEFSKDHFFSHNRCPDDIFIYLCTMVAHILENHDNNFYRRTTLGPLLIPYLEKLGMGIDIDLTWRHCIRDIHGTCATLEKMYGGLKKYNAKYHEAILAIYGIPGQCSSLLGSYSTAWFFSHLAVLPVHTDLPFYDHNIDMSQPVPTIINKVNAIVDAYLKKYSTLNIEPKYLPTVVKYGPQFEQQCRIDGERITGKPYTPDTLNYQEKSEIDDLYLPLYHCYLENITRLYQHVGIDFDGVLQRV